LGESKMPKIIRAYLRSSSGYLLPIWETSIVNLALENISRDLGGGSPASVTSSTSTATGQLRASIGVAIFGALLPAAHGLADGARIATIFTASTALIIVISGISGGRARAHALMRAKSIDLVSPEIELFRSDLLRIEDGC